MLYQQLCNTRYELPNKDPQRSLADKCVIPVTQLSPAYPVRTQVSSILAGHLSSPASPTRCCVLKCVVQVHRHLSLMDAPLDVRVRYASVRHQPRGSCNKSVAGAALPVLVTLLNLGHRQGARKPLWTQFSQYVHAASDLQGVGLQCTLSLEHGITCHLPCTFSIGIVGYCCLRHRQSHISLQWQPHSSQLLR